MAKGYWITLYATVSNAAAIAQYAKLAEPAIQTAAGADSWRVAPPLKAFEAGINEDQW
jgi:hypothetical protein